MRMMAIILPSARLALIVLGHTLECMPDDLVNFDFLGIACSKVQVVFMIRIARVNIRL